MTHEGGLYVQNNFSNAVLQMIILETYEHSLSIFGTVVFSKIFMIEKVQYGDLSTSNDGDLMFDVETNPNFINFNLWILSVPEPYKDIAEHAIDLALKRIDLTSLPPTNKTKLLMIDAVLDEIPALIRAYERSLIDKGDQYTMEQSLYGGYLH